LRLTQSKVGRDEEASKALGHAVLEEVATQAFHHLFVLKVFKCLLEKGRELKSRRRLLVFRGAFPPPSCTIRSCGEEALGGLSLKAGVSSPDAE